MSHGANEELEVQKRILREAWENESEQIVITFSSASKWLARVYRINRGKLNRIKEILEYFRIFLKVCVKSFWCPGLPLEDWPNFDQTIQLTKHVL